MSNLSVHARYEANGAINSYPGPAGSVGRQDNLSVGKMIVKRRDGTEMSVDSLLVRTEALESALVQAMKEKEALASELKMLKAKLSPSAESLDSRHAIRSDADDVDPAELARIRRQNRWRERSSGVVTETSGTTATRTDSHDPDEDPAEVAKRKRAERFRTTGGR